MGVHSLKEYVQAIRSSLKKPIIFLKRKYSDMMVLYTYIIYAAGIYMDIQFILDAALRK